MWALLIGCVVSSERSDNSRFLLDQRRMNRTLRNVQQRFVAHRHLCTVRCCFCVLIPKRILFHIMYVYDTSNIIYLSIYLHNILQHKK